MRSSIKLINKVAAIVAVAATVLFGNVAASSAEEAENSQKDMSNIVIGFLGPLSHPGDYRAGQANLAVAKLWVDRVNAGGGIDGREVVLEVADSQGKPEVATSQATRLITDKKVSAILGFWHSGAVLAASDVARRFNVPLLVHYSWDDQITKRNYDQVFRIGPYSGMLATRTLPFLRRQGYGRVVVMSEDSATTLEASKALKELAKDDPQVEVISFQSQSLDLTPQLSKLASNPPDALMIQAVYAASRIVFNQAAEVGLNVPMIAGWDYPTLPDFWPTVGKNGVGVIYPTFFNNEMELTDEGNLFKKIFHESNDSDPAIYQYLLWDCLNAIKNAITTSHSSEPAVLVEALQRTQMEGTTGHISFAREKGTVSYNQWDDVQMFFKRLTREGQTDADAETIMAVQ